MSKTSVIIPTYNRPASLKLAIQSVFDQGIKDLEMIVVDDCSEEEYLPKIEELTSSNEIHLIRNDQNLGAAWSRNKGLDRANGEFVLFLDDDDLLLPDMLKNSLEAIQEGSYDLVSCRSEVVGDLSQAELKRYNRQQAQKLHIYLMECQPVAHIFLYTPQIHTFLTRRESIGKTRFPTGLGYGEDLSFWLSLTEKGLKGKKLDFVGCRYYLHKDGASNHSDYKTKMSFYYGLLSESKHDASIQNLCHIKMAYLSGSQGKLSFFRWSLYAMTRPVLLFKHLRYYI